MTSTTSSGHNCRLLLALVFKHLLLIVLIDVEEVSRVEPGDREEVILILFGEFLLKTSEMYPESIFPSDVVHT